MLYASSKDRFKRELDGIQVELQATDPTEMGLDVIRGRATWACIHGLARGIYLVPCGCLSEMFIVLQDWELASYDMGLFEWVYSIFHVLL